MLSPHPCTGQELEQLCSNDYSLVTGSLCAPGSLTDLNLGTYLAQCPPGLKPIPKINRKLKPFRCCCAGRVCYLSENNCLAQHWAHTKGHIQWQQRGAEGQRARCSAGAAACLNLLGLFYSSEIPGMYRCQHAGLLPNQSQQLNLWPTRFPSYIKLLLQQVAFLLLNSN